MKIAVPVDVDKETIFKRTGQAPFFAIFENGNMFNFVANNKHTHDEHHDDEENHDEHVNKHKKDLTGLSGCDVILVQAIGEHMQEAVDSLGIKIQKIRKKDGLIATEAIKNFLEGRV